MQDLTGKVAVVTSGASGIGHAMATRFAAEGMKLVLVDIESDPLAEAAKAFEAETVEGFRALTAASMDAARVADRVHDAILDGIFYIHTHENHRAAVAARMHGILDGKRPALPEGAHSVFAK